MQAMPKIERIEGAPTEMKRACYDLIRHFTVAIECQEVRLHYIHKMFADIGVILASFELCIQFCLFTDKDKLRIAMQLERIEVVREEYHAYALSKFPELRRRLAAKGVRMNEKKFYGQPFQHGFEFLGTHIKHYRLHLNNKTYDRAVERIEEMNMQKNKYAYLDHFLASFNSYSGLLKGRTDFGRLERLKNMIHPDWLQWVDYDVQRRCLVYQKEYSIKERLNTTYHLKLKHYDTFRNHRAEKCSEQREVNITVAA